MLLTLLLLIPIGGIFVISAYSSYEISNLNVESIKSRVLIPIIPMAGVFNRPTYNSYEVSNLNVKPIKTIALVTSIINLFLSLIIFTLFDFSSNQFQFVQEYHEVSYFDFYLGLDGLSIYFVILTTIITPIALLSNWTSISENVKSYVIIILLLETLLLAVFLVLDILLFYIFFESILPPLFILIGLFGSSNKVRASFYLFLYTLLGSLFLLLSILTMSSIMGTTDFDALYKTNFNYSTQLLLFYGIFIAFAVKTPTIFLNTWLLKAHVESPLGGSIILAAIVLKLSLYGIFRLILPLLPKASLDYTYIIYLIGVITIIYASFSTLRTIDVKELIAYSSVSHAAVYLIGVFSNTIQGIEGGITFGLAHGFVSSGLFICAGGVLYDRSATRLISFYRGMAQIMPLFSILFFILSLGNCGVPLTLNFVGEFMSLYGVFERLPLLGVFASSSIVFSAAYTIYMFNRIAFGGSFSKFFEHNISDVNKREFFILLTLVVFTVVLGIYPAPILDGLHYSVSSLIYSNFNL
jgi:NADH-ubiquinone oxidoreductase chain 4